MRQIRGMILIKEEFTSKNVPFFLSNVSVSHLMNIIAFAFINTQSLREEQ